MLILGEMLLFREELVLLVVRVGVRVVGVRVGVVGVEEEEALLVGVEGGVVKLGPIKERLARLAENRLTKSWAKLMLLIGVVGAAVSRGRECGLTLDRRAEQKFVHRGVKRDGFARGGIGNRRVL